MRVLMINFFAFCLLVSFSSCVSTVPALFIQDGFRQLEVDRIYLLPTVDLRLDTTKELNLDKWVHTRMRKSLKQKKYQTQNLTDRSLIATISEENLLLSWLCQSDTILFKFSPT